LGDDLISANLGLAHQLARRFANRGEPHDDLVQAASLALIKAVDRFDPERGSSFRTFAVTSIVDELKRHFRDRGWAVRAPRRIQELYLELGHHIEELSQQLGGSPTVAELANAAGTTKRPCSRPQKLVVAIELRHSMRRTEVTSRSRSFLDRKTRASPTSRIDPSWRWLRRRCRTGIRSFCDSESAMD
jgi:RNA polymerase sigma factor (sigma-70 family)